MEKLVALLIFLPFVMALLMAIVPHDKIRAGLTYICGLAISALAIMTAVKWYKGGKVVSFDLPYMELIEKFILVGDFVLMFIVIYLSFKHKKYIISLLSIVQTLLVAGLEIFKGELGIELSETHHIRIDWLTIVMILIIGVIGVAIGFYAIGYMRGYHNHHKEAKDRRSFFFAIIFLFYGAMFGLVTSMSIIWLYFFWEVTSVCSFLLIGYTRTEEAINNSFRALWMNLLGGCGIAFAIAYAMISMETVNLYDLINEGVIAQNGSMALLPIAMLAFAALTKSAQFPFSGWLLGAMVAPTPSSALLHSATMVKAGVYLLIRLSPAMEGNYTGQMVYLIGGITFFVASCLAISQSDGKKVLAYSTVSNLGLIVACAGIGFKETTWAAVFLVIFHAVSKSVLFQCVGAIENATGSRDIEDMQGLAKRYPKLGFILMVGIAGMFLAPFGMLVSKWAALKAFVDAGSVVMVLIIVFGSSTTMFYWTKWLAKILGTHREKGKDVTQLNEYVSMFGHVVLLVSLCFAFPLISTHVVEPLMRNMYGAEGAVMSDSNIIIMCIMICGLFIIPLITYLISNRIKRKEVLAYMGGANTGDNVHFIDSMGETMKLEVSNWYMTDWCGEDKLISPAQTVCALLIVVFLCIIIGGAL